MDAAEALALSGAAPGTVIAAGYQSHGKGRFPERVWTAAAGENCMFTILLENCYFPAKPTLIPLASGLAVALAIEKIAGLSPEIRWPNDVLIHNKKAAGILSRMKGSRLFIGIGINLNQAEFDHELADSATSVFLETGNIFSRDDFLNIVLEKLFFTLHIDNLLPEIEKRLWHLKENCLYTNGDGGSPFEATIQGLGENGELCIIPRGKTYTQKLVSGSIRETTDL